MPVRVRHALALVLAGGVLLAGGTAAAAAPATAASAATTQHPASAASRPVTRFVAWQACSAAVWKWVAENAADGTTVDTHFHRYSAELEWRHDGGWYVQIAGAAHEPARANDGSSYCLVKGSQAHPRIAAYAYPR